MIEPAQHSYEQAQNTLRPFLDPLPVPIIELDLELNIVYINHAAQALCACSFAAMLEKDLTLPKLASLGDHDRVLECAQRVLGLQLSDDIEFTVSLKDEKPRLVKCNLEPLFQRSLISGLRACLVPILSEQKPPSEKASGAGNLETLLRINAGIVHDINNLLMAITGHADLAMNALAKLPASNNRLDRQLQMISDVSQRCSRMAGELLSFASDQSRRLAPTDIHVLINNAVRLLSPSFGHRINVLMNLNARESLVQGNALKLENALVNIIQNGCDAIQGTGTIQIATSVLTFSLTHTSTFGFEIPSGIYLQLSITDTGTGMTSNTKEKIFDPFFSNKKNGYGTGLGLANVHETVKACHGLIEVESAPGEGAQFILYLPLAEDGAYSLPHAVQMAE